MTRPPEPLFLARQSYRRRRLGDAARLLPILGAILFFIPLLWSASARTAGGMVFLFTAWACLILLAAIISRRLSTRSEADGPDAADPSDSAG